MADLLLRKVVTLLAGGLLSLMAQAQADGPDDGDLRLTEDGAYVVDLRSKLAWPRCVEGMSWNGKNCTGEPRLMTYGEARAWAASRAKTDGVAWRLPRVTELRRWAATGGKASSRLAVWFPAAPVDWYWTLTASIETKNVNPYNYGNIAQGQSGGPSATIGVQQGWAVNMATGEAEGNVPRRSRLVVRLVSSQ